MQSASTMVRQRLAAEERLKKIEEFFQLDEHASKQTVYVYNLLDSGFEGELTPEKIMEKMALFDIPTNPELLKRAHQTVNGLMDAPFNAADFLLLTVLAERARKVQEKLDEDGAKREDAANKYGTKVTHVPRLLGNLARNFVGAHTRVRASRSTLTSVTARERFDAVTAIDRSTDDEFPGKTRAEGRRCRRYPATTRA